MNTLIVLFRLLPNVDVSAYEAWAKSTDLPVVRKLPSVSRFDVYRTQGLFGSGDAAPYDYIEVIDISNLEGFGKDVSSETMRKVAAEFHTFADNPMFILTDRIS